MTGSGASGRRKRDSSMVDPKEKRHKTGTSSSSSPATIRPNLTYDPSPYIRHINTYTTTTSTSSSSSRSRGSKQNDMETSFSSKTCSKFFDEFSTHQDRDVIGPDGIIKLCTCLAIEPEDPVMLVLAFKMDAAQMGYFTRKEWLKGMQEIQIDSLPRLKSKLDYLRSLLNEQSQFKAIYRYAFDFSRANQDTRNVELATARTMMEILLAKRWPLFHEFNTFLTESQWKVMNRDQWVNVLEFSRAINQDMTNYDVDGAWPVMLDEFVDWYRAKRNQRQNGHYMN